ncbi:tumor necrosis factor receptor superfamily member 4 [Echeneis naucrates]|uniref:Tumor necrosis factor receptor superfamily member 4-like n=1 Tax=Echeneis naucrates TaxID=173247 RepID=A0A665SXK1_ECHNA|nr:tumor necrosis factor receptor superfamily member 4-like [Echeneis naucrates]
MQTAQKGPRLGTRPKTFCGGAAVSTLPLCCVAGVYYKCLCWRQLHKRVSSECAGTISHLFRHLLWYPHTRTFEQVPSMVLLKLLLFTLIFDELVFDLDATCPKGTKVNEQGRCENCPHGYYQPEENHSKSCKPCTRCREDRGSEVELKCTKVSDTTCRCVRGFVPWPRHNDICKCEMGFGIKDKECSPCEKGYFSTKINSSCQKWTKCGSGEKFAGNSTSDVICNTSLIQHEETQTSTMHRTPASTTTTTTETSRPTLSMERSNETQPPLTRTGNHIGMALLVFGAVGLLALTAVTCRLHIKPFVKNKPQLQLTKDSCRRPVEESGDDSMSPLKQNPV